MYLVLFYLQFSAKNGEHIFELVSLFQIEEWSTGSCAVATFDCAVQLSAATDYRNNIMSEPGKNFSEKKV